MDEFERPSRGFRSFNDFFIRKLKPGVRVVSQDPGIVVSPADSKLYVLPNVSTETCFFVKQKPFSLKKFLADDDLATQFKNGLMMIFRLAPDDYHRFHFPFDCTPSKPRVISGIFESVNPIVYKSGVQPLVENERHLILLETNRFDTVAMVLIGAMMVGKIVETYKFGKSYQKGQETGYFAFGGSTIVLLFKSGIINPLESFKKNSLQGRETSVKMGEAVTCEKLIEKVTKV